ncbi:UNVERIFIED_CONTAM: hypothetical protein Sangu_0387400 [Sesamum angustifolium]|uniref:Uncharacterized protein n=1 Tax=Sesamum angustifolium TaxID=2727405 RepID=A0AAW2QSB9_9LAMI
MIDWDKSFFQCLFSRAIGTDIVASTCSGYPILFFPLPIPTWNNGALLASFATTIVFAFALPFFLFRSPALLPFALGVEASPIYTDGAYFLTVASYCTNILINSLIDFSSPFILQLTMNGS